MNVWRYIAAMNFKHLFPDSLVWRDTLVACFLVIGVYLAAWRWNLAESLNTMTASYESIQLDELPLALFAAALALAWFSWRRMRDLEFEVVRRVVAERQQAALLAENRALAQHVRQAQEDERKRMAREIHDEIGQYLAAIRLSAATLPTEGDPVIAEQASRISSHAEHIQTTVRDLLHQLRPAVLDEYGLPDALRFLTGEWQAQHPDIECDLELEMDWPKLDEKLSITVYRLVQEALTNVVRHAQASRVEVGAILKNSGNRNYLEVTICDDGVGFTQLPARPCFGLAGMRERVGGVGGMIEIRTAFDAGVTVSAVIPLEK